MSEALEQLQEIGAQKIYEQTHIPAEHVQAILHGSYEGFNKVQFIGFISILEREYSLDLQTVKFKGIAYFDTLEKDEEASIFVQNDAKKKNKLLLALLLGVVAIVVMLVSFAQSQTTPEVPDDTHTPLSTVEEKVIEKKVLSQEEASIQESNSTQEIKQKQQPKEQVEVSSQMQTPSSFVIKTNKPLWIGYIDLKNNVKKQITIKQSFSLDPTKDWLLTLGHGYVTFAIGDETFTFQKKQGIKLLYKDGKLKEISYREFKRLNRGNAW